MIRRHGTNYTLYSKKTGRKLGTHRTRKGAERQETAIRLSKLRAQGRLDGLLDTSGKKVALVLVGGALAYFVVKGIFMAIPEPKPLPKDATLPQKLLWAAGFFKVVNAALPQLSIASQLMVTAHAVYESGWGTLNHLPRTNNPFNVTAGPSYAGQTYYQLNADKEYDAQGNVKTINQNWRVYPSLKAAITDYWNFLGGARYEAKGVRSYLQSADVDGFVRALSSAGYFTLPVDKYLADFKSILSRVKGAVGVSA